MKKRFILPLLASALLVSCGESGNGSGSNNEPVTPPAPDVSDKGDGYVDTLPADTKDGSILHCFNWTYKQVEDNLETIAKNGFKSIQLSPVQQPKSGGAQWWAYYQPVSLSIGTNSPLGTKAELKSMCDKAESLGISVIADIVFNHLANLGENMFESDGTPKVSEEVKTYEPEIYQHRNDKDNPTFHHNKNAQGAGKVTQNYPYGNLPDLNTSNKIVQNACYDLLKECIDVGIDGFRFDAAKHIETPTDKEYASDFWPQTLGKARTYYKQKTNKDLFAYGEVLNDPEGGRTIKDYTDLMYVTDSGYISSYLVSFIQAKPENLVNAHYSKNTDPSNLITWVESHDTFVEAEKPQKIKRVAKMWSVLASRKDSRGLFFARPDSGNTVGKVADYSFENEAVAAANRFHNRFVGCDEKQVAEGKFYINQRYNNSQTGAIIVSLGSDKLFSTNKLDKLKDGTYYDQITGKAVGVKNGVCEFEVDECGVAVLTKSKNVPHPQITFDEREGSFVGTKQISVSTKYATESYYKINGGSPVKFTNSAKIKIGDKVDSNKEVHVEIVAKNGDFVAKRQGCFRQVDLIPGGFNIVNVNPSYLTDYELYLWTWTGNSSKWTKEYQVKGTTLLVNTSGLKGFLLGLFPKGYKITNINKWDEKVIKQSGNIEGATLAQGFYDASSF